MLNSIILLEIFWFNKAYKPWRNMSVFNGIAGLLKHTGLFQKQDFGERIHSFEEYVLDSLE